MGQKIVLKKWSLERCDSYGYFGFKQKIKHFNSKRNYWNPGSAPLQTPL